VICFLDTDSSQCFSQSGGDGLSVPPSEYRIKYPTGLIESGLRNLKKHGEVSRADWKAFCSKRERYFRNLGVYTGVLAVSENTVIIDRTAIEEDFTDVPAATFRILTRFPLFRRWLKLREEYGDLSEIPPEELTTLDTRDSKERKKRPALYAEWIEDIKQHTESDQDPATIYPIADWLSVWDTFLGKLKADRQQRAIPLLCLCAGRQDGAAIDLNAVASRFDVGRRELETTIEEILVPLGIPLQQEGDVIALHADIILHLEMPDSISKPFESAGLLSQPLSREHGLKPLINEIRKTDIFTWQPPADEGSIELRIRSAEVDPIFEDHQTASLNQALQDIYRQSKTREMVTLPLVGERDCAGRLVGRLVDVYSEKETEAPVDYRSRTVVLGSIPLFEHPAYTELTTVGELLSQEQGSSKETWLQGLTYAAIPSARVGLILCDNTEIRSSGGSWRVEYQGEYYELVSLLDGILDKRGYRLICVEDPSQVSTQFVDIMRKLNMINERPATGTLEYTETFKERLQTDRFGLFSQYKQDERDIKEILQDGYA